MNDAPEKSHPNVARAVVKALTLFESPYYAENDYEIPGCAGLTWRELYVIVTYASEQLARDA